MQLNDIKLSHIPGGTKLPVYHSPVDVTQFLKFPQQVFTSNTRRFPYNRVYFCNNWKLVSTSKHEDLHSTPPIAVRDLFSLIQQYYHIIAYMPINRTIRHDIDNTNAYNIISFILLRTSLYNVFHTS